jgi:haloalkane dehalogenase
MCTVKRDAISDDARAGYLAPYGNPHDRIATLKFVEDVPLYPSHPTWAVVSAVDEKLARLREKPLQLVWGEQDWCFTPTFRKGWQTRFPGARTVAYSDGAHFVLEDKRDHACATIHDFVRARLAAKQAS